MPFPQSRREFIKQTLGVTGTLGSTVPFSRLRGGDRRPIEPDALTRFRARLKGHVVLPTDPGYDAARRVYFWNPETERRPALVAQCAAADDVRHAVEFARRHGLEVAVRGGGHSPMGWGASDGLVIDLAGMNRVTIDPATRTARIDAGSRQMQRPSLCDNREGFSFASTSIGVTRPLLPVSWAGPTTRVGC